MHDLSPSGSALLGLVSGFLLSSMSGTAADVDAWLKWRNGDELDGRIVEGSEESLRWRGKAFAEPLDIQLDQLEGIRFSTANREKEDDDSQFRVLMLNGDRLEGRIVEMGPELIKMT